jgi:hypothetical protein
MIRLFYKLYTPFALAITLMAYTGNAMETPPDEANQFFRKGYEILDEVGNSAKKFYNPRAIEQLKESASNFQKALDLCHPYAAIGLSKVYESMPKTEENERNLEEALLTSIRFKNKNYIRSGYLQDFDMLMWNVKKINPNNYSLNSNSVNLLCDKSRLYGGAYLDGLKYMESVSPERAIAVYGYLASQLESEYSDAAFEALLRLSGEWSSCYLELSFACFQRGNDEQGLSWLEMTLKIEKNTAYEEWLEKCIRHDRAKPDYYGAQEPGKRDLCWNNVVTKRDNRGMPLSFRLRSACLVNQHENIFANNFAYFLILQECKTNQLDVQSEIDRMLVCILKQAETDGHKLFQYASFFKNQLIEETNVDASSLMWNATQDNFVEGYQAATEYYDTLDQKSKVNIDMCFDLYLRVAQLGASRYPAITAIMTTPILLVNNLRAFTLYLAKDSAWSLEGLSSSTGNPVFNCIRSFVTGPKWNEQCTQQLGWQEVDTANDVLKESYEYAPQYDVVLYDHAIFSDKHLLKSKQAQQVNFSSYTVRNMHNKKDQLIKSLSKEEQFDLAMEYELIAACMNECQKPLGSMQDSYVYCLWLSASKGYAPAIQELIYLYTRGDKKHFCQTYFFIKEISPYTDICNVIMRNRLVLDWNK